MNPCDKIFDHKWLDPECVEGGCQSLRINRFREALIRIFMMHPSETDEVLIDQVEMADRHHNAHHERENKLQADLAAASNYVANDEVYPQSVQIAGRTISIVTRAGRTFLDVSSVKSD